MEILNTEQMMFAEVQHDSIVKEYAKRIKIEETINQIGDSQMELSPGMEVLAMVLDTISGRNPLYRLTKFFEQKNAELLPGTAIEADRFCDTNPSRAMGKIFNAGTLKIFSRLTQNSLFEFDVDARRLGFDTTSIEEKPKFGRGGPDLPKEKHAWYCAMSMSFPPP